MSVAHFGDYNTTETVIIPFNTFSSDNPSVSVTITDLLAADIEIHKDGGITQRASDNGVTVTTNFDGVTGNHIVSIDLSDNSDAGFYANGSRYQVRMEGTTVDGGTINAWIGAFSIGCVLRPTTAGNTLDVASTGEAGLDFGNATGSITGGELGVGAFAANSITSTALAANAVDEIVDAVWDEDIVAAHTTVDTAGFLLRSLIAKAGIADSGNTVSMVDASLTQADDYWNGQWIHFLTGNAAGQCRLINDFVAATDTVSWGKAVAGAIAASDQYVILPTERVESLVQGFLFTSLSEGTLGDIANNFSQFFDVNPTTTKTVDNVGGGSGLTALASGTAQAGTASTIQLAAGETFLDDELNGNIVKVTGGTGAGQARLITDYTASSDTADVTPNWTTNPSSDSTYEVVEGSVNVEQIERLDATDQINTQVDAGIETYNLHYILQTALPTNWATDITANSALDYMAHDGSTGYDRLTDSLQEIRDNQSAGSGLTPLASGTARAGGTSTQILLATAETFADDELNGNVVKITSGTGAGQSRLITDYTGSTDTADVTPAWTTNPDATSVYEVVEGSVNVEQIERLDATDQIRDAVVDDATRIDASALNTASIAVGSDGTGLTEAGGTGNHLTAVPYNSAWDASINAQVDAGIETYNLHYILQTALPTNWATDVTANSALDYIAHDGSTGYDRLTDSLQEIRDRGDAAWTTGAGTGLTPLATGTAQGGTASTIQLAAGETFLDDELNRNIVKITSGTGAGQARLITDYTGSTDTADVKPNWTTNPSSDSVYEIVEGINTDSIDAAALAADALSEIKSQVDASLMDIHLDHLLAVDYDPASKPGFATALLNELIESNAGVSRYTAAALAQAPTGGGDATAANQTTIIDHLTDVKGAGWTSTDTLEEIRNDTNELQTDDVPGLIAALNNIAASDVWDVDATGSQTLGTFGQAIGDPVANTKTLYAALVTDAVGVSVTADVATAQADLDIITGSDGVTLDTTQGNYAPATPAQVDTALRDIQLDHLLHVADAGTTTNDSIIAKMVASDTPATFASFLNTDDSLEAIRDRGDSDWTTGAGTGLTPLATGTAQSGTASTIVLAAGATFADNELNGNVIKITGGTGAGQSRLIDTNTGADDTCNVKPNWTTNPASDSTYEIVDGAANIVAALDTAIPASPTASSYNEVLSRLARSVGVVQEFTVDTGSFTATTTQCQVDAVDIDSLEATDDHYMGRVMIFTSGALKHQATDISDYDGTNKRFSYTALTEAPSNNDTFIVI